jgi:hypothetical protein
VDGTISKYMGAGHKKIIATDHEILPGVVEKFRQWESVGHRIILITGRRESVRQRTEDELRRLGIPFDVLLMGYADSGRVLINDIGSKVKAHAVNLVRDEGFVNADWERVDLD